MRRAALLTQVLTVNTVVIVATVIAAIAVGSSLNGSEATTGPRPLLVLAAAILLSILANNFVLRRRFAPLESLTRTMQRVDLAVPGTRAQPSDGESVDVAAAARVLQRHALAPGDRAHRRRVGRPARAGGRARARSHATCTTRSTRRSPPCRMRLAATAEGAPPEFAEELAETQRLATQAMHELLGLARELRPTALDDHGLVVALRTQVRMFGERWGIAAHFAADGTRPLLGEFEQIVAYRVVQEALSNAARHAQASQVKVTVSGCNAAEVKVTVTDDGNGFDPDNARQRALRAGGHARARAARPRADRRALGARRGDDRPADLPARERRGAFA